MATTLMTPGLKFFAEQIDPVYPTTGLYPTMSTYGILDLEGGPKRNELYVVCKDLSIQSVYEPDRPIGWELIEDGNDWYYRVTQMNHPKKRCAVRYHSRTEDPPAGRGRIGSVVTVERRLATPEDAEITEQEEEGEEVTSRRERDPVEVGFTEAVREYLEEVHELTKNVGAEEIAASDELSKIATIDPLLAQCAVIVGDPVQTAAMAKFAEGKMSYAEMRGLCG
jgi:hypothetical protein